MIPIRWQSAQSDALHTIVCCHAKVRKFQELALRGEMAQDQRGCAATISSVLTRVEKWQRLELFPLHHTGCSNCVAHEQPILANVLKFLNQGELVIAAQVNSLWAEEATSVRSHGVFSFPKLIHVSWSTGQNCLHISFQSHREGEPRSGCCGIHVQTCPRCRRTTG